MSAVRFRPEPPLYGGLAKWPNASDCKSAPLRVRWFESIILHQFYEPLAQLVEHLTFNQGVEGSSPSWLIESHQLIVDDFFCMHFCMDLGYVSYYIDRN